MWIQWKIFNKIVGNLTFDPFGGPKWSKFLGLFYTPTKVVPVSLQIRFRVNPVETFQENRRKLIIDEIYIDSFWPYLGPKSTKKIRPLGPFFTHTLDSTHNVHVKQVSWSHFKNVWEYDQKPLKFPFYILFCNKRFIEKLRSKKAKFYFHNLLGHIIVHIQAKYRKDKIKTDGSLFDLKKRLTDGQPARRRDGWASDKFRFVSSGAKNMISFPILSQRWYRAYGRNLGDPASSILMTWRPYEPGYRQPW